LVCFFCLELIGLFYDYSLNTVGDELALMSGTLKMISSHSLRPNFPSLYYFPVATYFYLPFFLVFLSYLRLSGTFSDTGALAEYGMVNYFNFLPVTRVISIFFGLVSVYLIYKISHSLFRDKANHTLTAFLLASSLIFVQISHFGLVWVPQVAMILFFVGKIGD